MFNFIEFFKNINSKTDKLNSDIKKGFMNDDIELNPFKEAFSQVYIWIDKDED